MNEVTLIKVELEKAMQEKDNNKTLELLGQLVNMPMTMQVLQDTHIGYTVNNIRKKVEDPEAVALCKKVVKKWKKLAESYKQQSNDSGATNKNTISSGGANSNSTINGSNNNNSGSGGNLNSPTTATNTTSNNTTSFKNTSSAQSASDQASPKDSEHHYQNQSSTSGADTSGVNAGSSHSSAPTQGVKREAPSSAAPRPSFIAKEVPQTNSAARLKFRQMITEALKHPLPKELHTDEPFLDEESLAARIEDTIFLEFKSDTDPKYRNRIRSRISNLKDNKNPYLRLNVLQGDISAERIAKMSTVEMASDELKQQREQFTREAINDHQMALTGGTSSSEIKCPACKKYDCTYNQMQTRSADEPMTTFCHCNNCGKRWKFC